MMAFKYSIRSGLQTPESADVADQHNARSHLHRLARDGKFPKPIKIGENRSAWLESDVQEWIASAFASTMRVTCVNATPLCTLPMEIG